MKNFAKKCENRKNRLFWHFFGGRKNLIFAHVHKDQLCALKLYSDDSISETTYFVYLTLWARRSSSPKNFKNADFWGSFFDQKWILGHFWKFKNFSIFYIFHILDFLRKFCKKFNFLIFKIKTCFLLKLTLWIKFNTQNTPK